MGFRTPMGCLLASVALGLSATCAKKSPTTPDAASTPPVLTTVVTITSSGANPRNIAITPGTRILFINNDNRSHNMTSDPHPEHDECPTINQVGFLAAGERRETGNMVEVRVCGFHDHDDPDTIALRGQIVTK
jgi:plastocyanin